MSQLVYHHGVYYAELRAGLLSNVCAWFWLLHEKTGLWCDCCG